MHHYERNFPIDKVKGCLKSDLGSATNMPNSLLPSSTLIARFAAGKACDPRKRTPSFKTNNHVERRDALVRTISKANARGGKLLAGGVTL